MILKLECCWPWWALSHLSVF